MPGDDLCEHVSQIGVRIDAIHFAGFDERRDNGPMITAAIRSGEEKIFAAESNLAVILPISGTMSSSTIVGTRFTDGARGAS
jgi:hypothetical protein